MAICHSVLLTSILLVTKVKEPLHNYKQTSVLMVKCM
jgi:hypothetical protein